jgi:hypothetical protein
MQCVKKLKMKFVIAKTDLKNKQKIRPLPDFFYAYVLSTPSLSEFYVLMLQCYLELKKVGVYNDASRATEKLARNKKHHKSMV